MASFYGAGILLCREDEEPVVKAFVSTGKFTYFIQVIQEQICSLN